ncbi:MAG: hypothetical protein ABII88_02670 [Candidatus Omnitrophota bacterium]
MKIKNKILILLLFVVLLVGCATGGFAQFKGKALELDLPVYSGVPPIEYQYTSLGSVSGEYNETSFLGKHVGGSLFAALEAMVKNAKDMGANAIIKVEMASGKGYGYNGEAVVFDELPK